MNKKLLFLVLVSLTLLSCQSQGQEEDQEEDQGEEGLRRNASLSSPYVDIGGDAHFPLLVLVWVNVDTSHTAQVQNNDPDFPLSYERPVSEEGFIPIVGLKFGDNNFDLKILDNNSKVVAEHSLTAEIEDQEDIQSWLIVEQAASSNDFSSVHVHAGSEPPFGDPKMPRYRLVVDDMGNIRWVYRWSRKVIGIFRPIMLANIFDNKLYIADKDGIRIVSVDVFGNREVVFNGDEFSTRYVYQVHHDFVVTNKGTLLILANPIKKTFLSPPFNSKRFFQIRSISVEDYIIEVDIETGLLMRGIDLKKIFRTVSLEGPRIEDVSPDNADWLHLNAIHYDSQSDSIIFSGRNQSAVFALDYATSTLKWLFADPANWQNMGDVTSSLLTAPSDYRYHKGQHDVRLDGNRLRFFDNSVSIKDTMGDPIPASKISSRIVEATLDLTRNEVTRVKTYEPKKELFSRLTGGFDFRDDNYLICYCGIIKNSSGKYSKVISEGQVFEIEQGSSGERILLHFRVRGFSYRAEYFDWEEMVK